MNKEIAKSNLLKLKDILPSMFLCYGTALGSIREGQILDHDLDTDIGILASDFNYELFQKFHDYGFTIRNIFGMINWGGEIALAQDGVKTDIMFFYPDGEKYWNCLWKNGCKNGIADCIKHEHSKLEIIKSKIDGQEFNCLGENHLIDAYGKDWRTPVKVWDWTSDHKCIKK